jgi:hypothetical protein
MGITDALERLQRTRLQPELFLAPIPTRQTNIFTYQNNFPLWFRLTDPAVGWWWFRPYKDKSSVLVERQAQPFEIQLYLEQLPRFLAVVLYGLDDGKAVVIPFNVSDANQRGLGNEPRLVYLANYPAALESLSIIVTRRLSNILLYDTTTSYHCVGIPKKVFAVARQIIDREQEQRLAELKKKTLDGRITSALDFIGAKLTNYREQESAIMVSYEYGDATHSIRIDKDMRVQSAGICLSGTDPDHNLTSIVKVMEESRNRSAWDW